MIKARRLDELGPVIARMFERMGPLGESGSVVVLRQTPLDETVASVLFRIDHCALSVISSRYSCNREVDKDEGRAISEHVRNAEFPEFEMVGAEGIVDGVTYLVAAVGYDGAWRRMLCNPRECGDSAIAELADRLDEFMHGVTKRCSKWRLR